MCMSLWTATILEWNEVKLAGITSTLLIICQVSESVFHLRNLCEGSKKNPEIWSNEKFWKQNMIFLWIGIKLKPEMFLN